MKYSLMSDLHIDFPQPKTPYSLLEQKVIIAGDTANGLEGLKFLDKLKRKGFDVYAVDGNHEHYRNTSQERSAQETTARFRENHQRYHDEDIPVVLANGWYWVESGDIWKGFMNDSRMGGLSPTDVNVMAVQDTQYIRRQLLEWKDHQRKGIVVTHTSPCLETLNPEYEGHYSNEWYWNPGMRPLLSEYADQILVWCHGHTHAAADKIVDGVRVVCNPRGYPGENPDWKPLTLEL